MKTSTLKKVASYKKIILPLITIIIVLVLWEVVAISKKEPLVFPPISYIFKSFINLFTLKNLKLIMLSLLRIIISVMISFVIALLIGFLYIWRKDSYHFFKPIISLMRSVPLAVISIFLFILLNSNIAPFVITILVILPITVEGIISALDGIDQNILDDLKLINTDTFKSLFYVYIPLIKNYLLMVLVQTFGLGLKVMIMGEFICYTKNSIGKELSIIKSAFDLSSLIAWGILIVLIVTIIEIISKLIINYERKKSIYINITNRPSKDA